MTLVLLAVGTACGGSEAARKQATEIQGKPPTPETDPFFYVARPPESAKAETKGTIGDPEPPEKKTSKPAEPAEPTGPDPETLRRELMVAEAARDEIQARLLEAEARNKALAAQLAEAKQASRAAPEPVTTVPGEQCFSCVKICPAKGRCPDDAEIVCGWGTGKNRKDAMLRATTECDAALDIVRGGAQWSRVEGQCPIASCN